MELIEKKTKVYVVENNMCFYRCNHDAIANPCGLLKQPFTFIVMSADPEFVIDGV